MCDGVGNDRDTSASSASPKPDAKEFHGATATVTLAASVIGHAWSAHKTFPRQKETKLGILWPRRLDRKGHPPVCQPPASPALGLLGSPDAKGSASPGGSLDALVHGQRMLRIANVKRRDRPAGHVNSISECRSWKQLRKPARAEFAERGRDGWEVPASDQLAVPTGSPLVLAHARLNTHTRIKTHTEKWCVRTQQQPEASTRVPECRHAKTSG